MPPSYSKYPSAIDDSSSLPISTDLVTEVKAEVVNRLRDSVLKIQNELGINPSAEFGTVKDRLDTLKVQASGLVEAKADIDLIKSQLIVIESSLLDAQLDILNIQSEIDSIQLNITNLSDRIYADNFFVYDCGELLEIGQVVSQSGSNSVVLADAANELPAFGFIVEKPTTTSAIIQTSGEISISALAANETYYLSEISPGEITETVPSISDSFIQSVGYAKNSDVFMIQITHQLIFL